MRKQYSKPMTMQLRSVQPAQMLAASNTFIPIGGEDDFSAKENPIRDSEEISAWDSDEW